MIKLTATVGRFSKLIGTLVGVLASVPITTLVPGLPAVWATLITAGLAAAGTAFAPKNKP